MTSEIRANTSKNRVGLGTISFTNTGPVVSGIITATGADINGDLDVDGHTNLDNVSIVGVTTFNGLSTNDVIRVKSLDSNGISKINILSEGTTGSSRILFSDTAATTGDAWINYSHNDRAITFTTAGTGNERLRIAANGTIGIGGTTIPGGLLDLSSAVPSILFSETGVSANNGKWLNAANGSELYWQAQTDAHSGGGNLFKMTRSAQQIQSFEGQQSGVTWFTIRNSDKTVGIGTNSPGTNHNLEILGNASAYATLNLKSQSLSHGSALELGAVDDDDYGSIYQFASGSGEGGRMRFTAGGQETMNLRGGVVLVKGTSAIGSGTGLEVTYNGSSNHGRVLAQGFIARDNYGAPTNAGNSMYSPAANTLAFSTNSGERLRIDSNGDINLGNNPTNQYGYKLNIQDSAIIYAQTASSGGLESKWHLDNSAQLMELGTVTTDALALVTNNLPRLRITSGGYVTKPGQPMVGCRHFSQNGSTVYNDGNDIIALRFHNIDVNVGNHFNNTTGIFTCPVDGNYFISCQNNLRATNNAWSSLYIIYKPSGGSSQKLSDQWAPSQLNNSWTPISASHLCNCNAGDELSMAYSSGYSAPSNSSTSGGVQMSIFLFG